MDQLQMRFLRRLLSDIAITDTERAYGHCHIVSKRVVERLSLNGYGDARVVTGNFNPSAPKETWAKLARRSWEIDFGKTPVSHAWVLLDDHIIDGSAAQFGEPPLLIVHKADPRYIEVPD
jgi:hypothetical protein